MSLIIAVACVVVLLFGVVVFVGAPYLPTLRPQIDAAFTLLKLHKGQTLLELGCGDGRVLVEAAKRGYRAVGVELNVLLVLVALWRTRRYRRNVTVLWGNYWRMSWPPSDAVFAFLIDGFMPKLHERMLQYGGKLVSVAFKIPDRQAITELDGVRLYEYGKKLARTEDSALP